MSARSDFKNSLQTLTTLVVKAEAARGHADEAFAELQAHAIPEWKRLRGFHAVYAAEVRATDPTASVPHATWLADTEKRAEALFGPLATD